MTVGLYTLIVAVTLWTTCSPILLGRPNSDLISPPVSTPKKSGNAFLLTVVVTLYVLTTVTFGVDWAYQRHAFIRNGDNFFTVFVALQAVSPWWKASQLVIGISSGLSTFIVDITIVRLPFYQCQSPKSSLFLDMALLGILGTSMADCPYTRSLRHSRSE